MTPTHALALTWTIIISICFLVLLRLYFIANKDVKNVVASDSNGPKLRTAKQVRRVELGRLITKGTLIFLGVITLLSPSTDRPITITFWLYSVGFVTVALVLTKFALNDYRDRKRNEKDFDAGYQLRPWDRRTERRKTDGGNITDRA